MLLSITALNLACSAFKALVYECACVRGGHGVCVCVRAVALFHPGLPQ